MTLTGEQREASHVLHLFCGLPAGDAAQLVGELTLQQISDLADIAREQQRTPGGLLADRGTLARVRAIVNAEPRPLHH